jgi:hypothetical protein
MTTQGCRLCPLEASIDPMKNLAIVITSLTFSIAWLWYSWSPLFPSIAQYMRQILCCLSESRTDFVTKKEGCSTNHLFVISSNLQNVYYFMKGANITQYFKIFVGYFQITASFLSFQVQWPATLLTIMMWLKATVNFNILSLPTFACFWRNITFRHKLLVYTVVPLLLVGLLLIPCCIAYFNLRVASNYFQLQEYRRRYEATLDRFWNAVMFIAFMMYPLVCLVTLEPFDCQPYGLGLLAADLREPCPDILSFDKLWASIFIIMYPAGIPLASIIVLRTMGVHKLAQEKIDTALISAMINLFIKRTTSVESQRIAQILGPVGADKEGFLRRARELHRFLWHDTSTSSEAEHSFRTHKLKVQIKQAELDRYESVNLYCTINFAGRFERTTAKRNSKTVSWNGEEFVFDIMDENYSESESQNSLTLKLKVMEWDRLGKNKLVGEIEINQERIKTILSKAAGHHEVLELSVPMSKDHITGTANNSCFRILPSSSVVDGDLPKFHLSFQIQVEITKLPCSLAGSEIAKLKQFAASYDEDKVMFGKLVLSLLCKNIISSKPVVIPRVLRCTLT